MRRLIATFELVGPLLMVLAIGLANPAQAQRATLTGKVTDAESGEALPGANVVVVSSDIETGAATKTDGQFVVRNLPPGTYKVTVSYIGYETKVLDNVTVSAGETKNIAVSLGVTGIEFNAIAVSASRREEKTLDAPASITVLEAREIQTEVAPSSSALLRNVTGIDMASTGVDRKEIVLRGFNNAFSGAAYVLTDYRQAAVASLGVNVHSIMPNMSVDLDRVEIVRGPGSALYGAGVDAGVIHYLTKDPFAFPGTTVSVGGGERSTFAGQFRHAGVVSDRVGYKITGQFTRADDFELNPNDPLDAQQLANDAKDPNTGQPLNPRNYDYKKFNINGELEYRFSDKTTLSINGGFSSLDAIVLTGIGTVQADNFGYTYVQARLRSGNFFAQTYLNRNDVGDSFVYGTGTPLVDNSTLFNIQTQYEFNFAQGKENLVVGFDYDRTTPKTGGTIYGRNEDRDLISEPGFYAQSATKISDQLDFIFGGRADFNNIQDEFQLSPRVALVYKPTPQHSLRLTYNRAFASPGNNSNFLDIVAREPDATLPIRIRG
ncbi:MAG: TonB-dependent receptor, partial [Calditrichaeota bacterium]